MIVQGAEIASDAVVENLISIEGAVLLEFQDDHIEIWCGGKRVASFNGDDAEAIQVLLDSFLKL